jgi:hypothetical protein
MLHAANINLKKSIFVGYSKWVVLALGASQNTELFGTYWFAPFSSDKSLWQFSAIKKSKLYLCVNF